LSEDAFFRKAVAKVLLFFGLTKYFCEKMCFIPEKVSKNSGKMQKKSLVVGYLCQ